MTEISNVKSGGQVLTLKAATAKDPANGSGGIDRFASGGKPSPGRVETSPTANSASLDKGQDPLTKAAEAIEEFVGEAGPNTKLRIDKDDDTGRFVYKSVDSESGEVVAQFPPETILEMISKFRDPEGLVVDDQA
jgi:flagellar protein FlaG